MNFPEEEEEETGAMPHGKGSRKGGPPSSTERCYICGEPGHFARQCPNQEQGVKCYRCNGFGHLDRDCPHPKGGGKSAKSEPYGRGGGGGRGSSHGRGPGGGSGSYGSSYGRGGGGGGGSRTFSEAEQSPWATYGGRSRASCMISAATLYAQFGAGDAQTCSTEVAVLGKEMVKAPMISGRDYYFTVFVLVLWALISQVLALRAVWKAIREMFGAVHPELTPRTSKSKKKRGDAQAADKSVQAEVHDLDGLTVQGLQALCARFGLKRSGLRSELILRVNSELDVRSARCASEQL